MSNSDRLQFLCIFVIFLLDCGKRKTCLMCLSHRVSTLNAQTGQKVVASTETRSYNFLVNFQPSSSERLSYQQLQRAQDISIKEFVLGLPNVRLMQMWMTHTQWDLNVLLLLSSSNRSYSYDTGDLQMTRPWAFNGDLGSDRKTFEIRATSIRRLQSHKPFLKLLPICPGVIPTCYLNATVGRSQDPVGFTGAIRRSWCFFHIHTYPYGIIRVCLRIGSKYINYVISCNVPLKLAIKWAQFPFFGGPK